jgi:glycosyltransferase involved in cell wall biosynthesis
MNMAPHSSDLLGDTQPPLLIPHVHILMGCYNGGRYLREQLQSFKEQRHQAWSLWISDDGSTDDTLTIIREFDRACPGRLVRLLEGPRQGSAANFLSMLCHPDLPPGIVALSDQDDVWMPDKLDRAVSQLLAAGPGPCVWSARYQITNSTLTVQGVSSHWPRGPSLANAMVQNILSGHTLTLNPAALEIVRRAGPQPVPHHDWWIYLLIMASGGQALVDEAVVLKYRQHAENVMGFRASPRAILMRLESIMNGDLQDWIAANLRALRNTDLPFTQDAVEILETWSEQRPVKMLRLLRDHGIHRQSPAETALIHLAAALGKL